MKVTLGVSNRHVHLNKEDLEILFGKDYQLKEKCKLGQPGQFSSTDVVSIRTSKAQIDNVRVIGPTRDYTQVEISRTDAYKLGINPPISSSGDLLEAAPIIIIGPNAVLEKEHACIQANRHIHITEEQKKEFGLANCEKIQLKVEGIKGGILDNVYLKVAENSLPELHLDTDDSNAFMLKTGDELEIINED